MDLEAIYREIFAPFDKTPGNGPFVVGQIGQSLDGRVATIGGDADNVSGTAGLDHLHRLRARADVVVVGAGTVATDDPRLTVRRAKGRNPARAIIDASGRTAGKARWLAEDGVPRIRFVAEGAGASPPGVENIVLPQDPDGALPPPAIIEALFDRGMRTILIEGGPSTLARFIEAGCIDRLHVFVSPLIIGSGKPALELTPVHSLAEARRPRARIFVLDGEALFDCDMRT